MVPDPDEPDRPVKESRLSCPVDVVTGSCGNQPRIDNKETEEEKEFGNGLLGFPTSRRPARYTREMKTEVSNGDKEWFLEHPNLVGDLVSTEEQTEVAKLLLATWRDLFVTDVEHMPATDLLEHRIPTYSNSIPKVAKIGLFTPEEVEFQ